MKFCDFGVKNVDAKIRVQVASELIGKVRLVGDRAAFAQERFAFRNVV